MVVPRFNKIDDKRRRISAQSRTVESDTGAGILRSQTDDYGPLDAVGDHRLHCIGNEWLPIAHSDVHWSAQFVLQKLALFESELGERRMPNQPVSMLYFLHHLIRQGPAAGDLKKKFRYFIDGIRAAVGQQQDGAVLEFGIRGQASQDY